MSKRVYLDENSCMGCDNLNDFGVCTNCLNSTCDVYHTEFRRIAPRADKVVIVARNTNWKGDTGYLVVDFNYNVMKNILEKTDNFTKRFYKEGKRMYIQAFSHDVPTGGIWTLYPMVSKGRSNTDLIKSAIKSEKVVNNSNSNHYRRVH